MDAARRDEPSSQEYVSPDGRLRFRVETDGNGDVTLGFVGCYWHTHADLLAAITGRPEDEAVRRFLGDLISSVSVIAVWSIRGEVKDVRMTDDPAGDAALLENGETVALRYWDGSAWSA